MGFLFGPPDPRRQRKNMSERWYRKLARTETKIIRGVEYTLQSVSPKWYFDTNDRCGMTGDRKDMYAYMDAMIKNVVVSPPEVAAGGMRYFDAQEDIATPEALIKEIERFLRPPERSGGGNAPGQAQ